MAYELGALETTLTLAAGDDPALIGELRNAFVDSLEHLIDLLGRARCDANWHLAAMRLKGLAASFHAEMLIGLAEEALDSAPGDPAILRKLDKLLAEFSHRRV